jgi:hypothetical protein
MFSLISLPPLWDDIRHRTGGQRRVRRNCNWFQRTHVGRSAFTQHYKLARKEKATVANRHLDLIWSIVPTARSCPSSEECISRALHYPYGAPASAWRLLWTAALIAQAQNVPQSNPGYDDALQLRTLIKGGIVVPNWLDDHRFWFEDLQSQARPSSLTPSAILRLPTSDLDRAGWLPPPHRALSLQTERR